MQCRTKDFSRLERLFRGLKANADKLKIPTTIAGSRDFKGFPLGKIRLIRLC